MTATIEASTLNETLPRKRFTKDEVHQLLDTGFFTGQRFELINGDLIDKMGQKPSHACGIQDVQAVLMETIPVRRLRNQLPFETEGADNSINEPEPDLAVVAGNDQAPFRTRHPRGSDFALVVEVSDTTLRNDLTTKRGLYARSGVPQYWVLDLVGRQLIVHRNPNAGRYAEVLTLASDATVDFEGATLLIAHMLPAAS